VNCFHFWVSLRYDTTKNSMNMFLCVLWIAFIFEYLWDMTQLPLLCATWPLCCELLSFLSIFEIWHNITCGINVFCSVVNCFHFWVSLRYDTTSVLSSSSNSSLWIAFIFEYLWDMTQHFKTFFVLQPSCELLSFLSIFEIWHNDDYYRVEFTTVVNCFHFWVSLRYDTTTCGKHTQAVELWIAFIFEYLWDMTQLKSMMNWWSESCELLSFLSIFEIWHNFQPYKPPINVGCELLSFLSIFEIWHNIQISEIGGSDVVNCFHFWVSLRYDTTLHQRTWELAVLWIAFIFEYLWDMTQPPEGFFMNQISCELLSFLSIFEIWHNSFRYWRSELQVVNCFHFWVSLRYDTTL